jgi:hypothetical protein
LLQLRVFQIETGPKGAESLSFLTAKSRTCFNNPGHLIDAKMSRLKQDSTFETTRFRQAVYLAVTTKMLMPDPCWPEAGYKRILACFIEQLMHNHYSRSATVCGYVKAIHSLFVLRSFQIPGDLTDRENMCTKIINVRESKENVAEQRSPFPLKCMLQWSQLLDHHQLTP